MVDFYSVWEFSRAAVNDRRLGPSNNKVIPLHLFLASELLVAISHFNFPCGRPLPPQSQGLFLVFFVSSPAKTLPPKEVLGTVGKSFDMARWEGAEA